MAVVTRSRHACNARELYWMSLEYVTCRTCRHCGRRPSSEQQFHTQPLDGDKVKEKSQLCRRGRIRTKTHSPKTRTLYSIVLLPASLFFFTTYSSPLQRQLACLQHLTRPTTKPKIIISSCIALGALSKLLLPSPLYLHSSEGPPERASSRLRHPAALRYSRGKRQ